MGIVDNIIGVGGQSSSGGGGGGEIALNYMSRVVAVTDTPFAALTATLTAQNMPTLKGSRGNSVTWNGAETFEINEDGIYILSYLAVSATSTTGIETSAAFFRDTGTGFTQVNGTFSAKENSGSSGLRTACSKTIILSLSAGDKIQLRMAASGGTTTHFATTSTTIAKLKGA